MEHMKNIWNSKCIFLIHFKSKNKIWEVLFFIEKIPKSSVTPCFVNWKWEKAWRDHPFFLSKIDGTSLSFCCWPVTTTCQLFDDKENKCTIWTKVFFYINSHKMKVFKKEDLNRKKETAAE